MTSNLRRANQSPDFIGRKTEIAEIVGKIRSESCRLLTLVGVGGVGKTRLALQITHQLRDEFTDGFHFVDLQASQTANDLVSAIASTLEISFSGQAPPAEQLLHFLQPKHMLIVLDNFEQLVESGSLLSQIIQQAPDIKLLVTSRETLKLREEHRFALKGLEVPESHQTESLAVCDSVRLFVERAKRIRTDFSLAEQRAGVVRICQLVEGMPLALEMAASWVGTLRCANIAAEIQHNLNFLQSNLRNTQERHQSMEAVFAQTWNRLSHEEKQLFTQFSVFRGGFQREAAEMVAGASLPLLASLLNKCLIRRDQAGRYHIHELLRQFGAAKLTNAEATRAAENHSHYFANFMSARKRGIVEKDQLETSREIERDLENIRAAWRYATDQKYAPYIEKMAAPYFYYCQIRSRFLESARASEQAVAVLDGSEQTRLIAQIQVYWGWMLIRIGQFVKAAEVLEQSQATFERLDMVPAYGMGSHPLTALPIVCGIKGDYHSAVAMGEQLKQESEAHADLHNLSFACYALTSAYLSMGQYDDAQTNAQQAVDVADQVGNIWFKAYCLIEWGKVALVMSRYNEARAHFRASLRIREDFDDPEGIAVLSVHLGEIAVAQHDYRAASQLFDRSLSIYQNLNDRGGLATGYRGLGRIAMETGQTIDAAMHFREALTVAVDIQFLPLVLNILLDVADLLLRKDLPQLATSTLQVVSGHPASDAQHKQRVAALLSKAKPDHDGESLNLETLLHMLQTELEDISSLQSSMQSLVVPLTPREIEVLQMIAAGLTNPEIAEKLVIAPGTVKAHTSSIYSKLGVANRTEAVTKSHDIGILS